MSDGKYKDILKSFGFQCFLWTQFLGAFNDSAYKITLSLLILNIFAGPDGGGGYLSLIGAVFILPFFLFSGYAGYLADVFNKRSVLIVTKSLEIAAMSLGLVATLFGGVNLMLVVLFLMALQSALFGPAKYGIVPEMFPDKDISRVNGLLEMTTFLAIILGTSVGSVMFSAWKDRLAFINLVLILIAVVGTATSFRIPKVTYSGTKKPFRLNPWSEVMSGIRRLYSYKILFLAVLGMSYFWFLGALLQMDILLFGKEIMGLNDLSIGFLGTFMAVGIGIGSLVAGRLSGDKVELGLVPLGSIGMGLFSLWLSFSGSSYVQTSVALALLGFSGGLFTIPLNALLQQKSEHNEKGRLIATNNFLNTIGILLASGAIWFLRKHLLISADRIILIFGLLTLVATVYILKILPDFLIRFSLWMLTHTIYKIRIVGQEHVPFRGPALLVCNHMSFIDALLVGSCVQRFIRFMIYKPYYEQKSFHWLFRLMNAIPYSDDNRKEMLESLSRAREELRQGHVVCIFAEGTISRIGNLLPFKSDFEKVVEGLNVPIIPVHLDGLWGSVFSFKGGKFFWKWPEKLPYPVTVSFDQPLPSPATAQAVRQAVMELGSNAVEYRRTTHDLLHLRFIKTAKRRWSSFCMTDSSGKEMTFGQTLVGSLLLARWIQKQWPDDKMVGILLPSSIGGALANIAVLLAGKVSVNINFTSGKEGMASAIQQCNIRLTLTSRMFLSKANIEKMEGMVFIEDLFKQITPFQKFLTLVSSFLLPSWLISILMRHGKQTPNDLATVIFSSGTTGTPKGVMLSHHNIISNIEGVIQIFSLTKGDRIMGVLPFFHSFGFTVALWLPLISGFGAVYHANPMDAATIGQMVSQYKATILISTPTFYGVYLRKCSVQEFSSLRYAMTGAEKLREQFARAFKEKYGIDLLEGYGCTEMSPVISVNIPNVLVGQELQIGSKFGMGGHPIPGVAVKVVDPETGNPLPYNQEGLLLVKGHNRMIGYLGQPEKTKEAIKDGWYITGDIGSIDSDGFIRITDRLSRFSKIGGEMVPHSKVEETINQICGDYPCVVTSIPDEQKGERLVVLYTHKELKPDDLWGELCKKDIPKLWIPKRENFYHIETIPTLGTGKVNLKMARTIASERAGQTDI